MHIDMETLVRSLNSIVVNICQLLALFVISIGIIKALFIFLKHNLFNFQSATAFQESRLQMGYSFSLGLGFLIGASILKTTIAPKWNDIGQLAAIIAIRTVLNYLLLQAITNSSEPLEKSSDSQDVDKSKLVGSVDR
ncbi:MAG: DUF1622 domain-containing protein [Coleofasciculus sp. G3-WIS-01]|uniref:DUF1622 domain-containing protein n=1 Tax=Coleofasciculus sp. G3-WIS-01 TaxID=3069528 RepID=UPI0032FCA1DB